MNKLVSKNPVLRFKLDKKIVKALDGVKIFGAEMGPQSSKIVRAVKPYIASAIPFARYFGIRGSANALIDGLTYIENGRLQLRNQLNTSTVKPNPRTSTRTNSRTNPKTSTKNTTNLNTPHTPLPNGAFNNTSSTPRTSKPSVAPTYYATRAYRNKILPEGLNSRATVMEYLKKLNRFGANIKPDGIWGDETQAAYEALLKKITPNNEGVMNLGTMNNIEASVNSLLNPNPILSPDSWIAKANSLNNLHYNIDPIFAKQGAKLVSRNPVERFLQGRNLPTAPKAEKRFRKSSYNITKDGNRETTTITSQAFGYNRNWPYFRQPATILRIIQDRDTAFVETPEHHIFTKVHPRTALKSGNVYVEYNPKYDEKYSLYGQANTGFNYHTTPLEYETLKRRFNTAWNLAK